MLTLLQPNDSKDKKNIGQEQFVEFVIPRKNPSKFGSVKRFLLRPNTHDKYNKIISRQHSQGKREDFFEDFSRKNTLRP